MRLLRETRPSQRREACASRAGAGNRAAALSSRSSTACWWTRHAQGSEPCGAIRISAGAGPMPSSRSWRQAQGASAVASSGSRQAGRKAGLRDLFERAGGERRRGAAHFSRVIRRSSSSIFASSVRRPLEPLLRRRRDAENVAVRARAGGVLRGGDGSTARSSLRGTMTSIPCGSVPVSGA